MKTVISALSLAALQILAPVQASAATTVIACLNRHSFNYGQLEIVKTPMEVTVRMQSTTLGSAGRELIGEGAERTRSLKMVFPLSDCALSEVGTKLPARCHNQAAGSVELTDVNGNVQNVALGYAQIQTLVRVEDSIDRLQVHSVIAELNLYTADSVNPRSLKEDTHFDFNECSRSEIP